jgi:maltose O-acetyltransferase
VRKTAWALRRELRLAALWLIGGLPLRFGMWVRARLLPRFLGHLGADASIQQGFRVTMPEHVRIGAHCNFGQHTFITGGGGVTIGDWVGFGPDVKVWSVNHRFDDPDTPWQLQGWEYKPVVIEDDVWLGANVFVMPGVTIGRGAIVSAGTVLNKSVPAFAVVAGNPGRVVGWRKRPAEVAVGMEEARQP